MTPLTGEQLVDAIQEDLECPQCRYNLRGLRGVVVTCPECGLTCDVAKLISTRWTAPWYKAPKLSRVSLPTALLVMWFVAWMALTIWISLADIDRGESWAALFTLPLILPYLLSLRGAYKVFGDIRGVHLALLSHCLLAGYVFGIVGFVSSFVRMVLFVFAGNGLGFVGNGVFVVLMGGLVWICRRGEKYVAKACIRRYLAVKAGER